MTFCTCPSKAAGGAGLQNAVGATVHTPVSPLLSTRGGQWTNGTLQREGTDALFYTTVPTDTKKNTTSRFYPIHGTRSTSHVPECLLDVCFLDSTFKKKSLFSSSVTATIPGQGQQQPRLVRHQDYPESTL